jgi:hypothetical protein
MMQVSMGSAKPKSCEGSRRTKASRRRLCKHKSPKRKFSEKSSKRKSSIHRGHDGDQDGDFQPKRRKIEPQALDAEIKSMLLKLRESTEGFMVSHRGRHRNHRMVVYRAFRTNLTADHKSIKSTMNEQHRSLLDTLNTLRTRIDAQHQSSVADLDQKYSDAVKSFENALYSPESPVRTDIGEMERFFGEQMAECRAMMKSLINHAVGIDGG